MRVSSWSWRLLCHLAASCFVGVSAEAATVACTPTTGFNNCFRITYSGAAQSFVVPAGVTRIEARVWGAAGGGANDTFYLNQGGGAGGGFASGLIDVTPGQTLTLIVGQGGIRNSIVATFGGGGAGGTSTATARRGGSGGGMSGIFNNATLSQAAALVIAGGGGGASPGADAGTAGAGGGGGTSGGEDALPLRSGRGGTQITAGAAASGTSACVTAPSNGAALAGGAGGSSNGSSSNEGGGGGGGGYFGGGGGLCQNGPAQNGGGGGGASYTGGTGVTSGATSAGANFFFSGTGCTGTAASGGAGNALYTAGIGRGNCFGTGGNGEIVIQYATATLTLRKNAVSGTGTFNFAGDNGFGTDSIAVAVANTTVSGTAKTITAGKATTITETIPSGWLLTNVTCTGLGSGGTATPMLATGQLVLDAAAVGTGGTIVCTFRNLRGLPALTLVKQANTTGPVNAGDTITYTYTVRNTGNVAINGVTLAETFNGTGAAPVPSNETLQLDAAPSGDSSNGTVNDGVWQSLGPGAEITFSATYGVVQQDIDTLQ